MFQFCLKISCLPFLTVYSMLLTLLSNYPEPCLAFLFGLVMFPPETFLIILLPLEHMPQAGRKASPTGWQGLCERTSQRSPQILLTFQQRAVGVNYWLQKSQWQYSHLWEGQEFPFYLLVAHLCAQQWKQLCWCCSYAQFLLLPYHLLLYQLNRSFQAVT